MNSLNSLKSIIQSLKKNEIKSLIRFLDSNKESDKPKNSKSILLVKLILNDKNILASELQKNIYGTSNYHAFNKLVGRLKEKVLEIIMFDSNLNENSYSHRNKTIFELRKKLIQIDILFLKGIRISIENQYNLIINKSKKFESYDTLIQALYSKQRFIESETNANRTKALKDDINNAEKIWISYNQSQALFRDITVRIGLSNGYYKYKNQLKSALEFLKAQYELTKSSTIEYYYYFLLTEKEQNEMNYLDAEKCLETILGILKLHKSVYTQNRYGSTLINIANNKIFLLDFDSAILLSSQSKKYFQNQLITISVVEEIEFYSFYYKGDLSNAYEIIQHLVAYPVSVNSGFYKSRRLYILGCVNFLIGEYYSALNSFLEFHEIERDKEGWNIAKRIAVILCRIELEELESTDLNLQSLEKFLKRMLKTKAIHPRYIIIGRIIKKLVSSNFDYQKVYLTRKKYFDLLESSNPDFACKMRGAELIVFEEWFKFKLQKRKYNHQEAMHNFIERRKKNIINKVGTVIMN